MNRPYAIFHANASVQVGTGHVHRSLVLANELGERGWRCAFDVPAGTEQLVPQLAQSPHALIDGVTTCDLLVVDDYEWDATTETTWRPKAGRILVIDDLANRPHNCDILVDQTVGRRPQDYGHLLPDNSTVLAGTDYALLRPEFESLRASSLDRRKAINKVSAILVTMGGTDAVNATTLVIDGISEAGLTCSIDIVLGPGSPHIKSISERARRLGSHVTVTVGSTDMSKQMAQADFSFGAAGSTAWERCCLGLPTAMIVTADNQNMIAKELDKAGAAINLGQLDQVRPSDIADTLALVNDPPGLLQRMALRASEVCDGRGSKRVSEALAA